MLDFHKFLNSLKALETIYDNEPEAFMNLVQTQNTHWGKFSEIKTLTNTEHSYIDIDIPKVDMISDFSVSENSKMFLVLSDRLISIGNNFTLLTTCLRYNNCKLRIFFSKNTEKIELKYTCSIFTPSVNRFLNENTFIVDNILYENGVVNPDKL